MDELMEDEIAKELELLSDDCASEDGESIGDDISQLLALNLKEPDIAEVKDIV